jgi:lipopolysaccharide biosynthesis glycosyltransferase
VKINIAYSCDEAYVQHTGISMISLFENNRDFDKISVYFIAKDVSEKSINILRNISVKYKREFLVVNFEKLCKRLRTNTLGRHIETVYAKLFFSQLEDIDKILYLDSDTIINGSLRDLWNTDISNYLIAGVKTFTIGAKSKLGLNDRDNYINDRIEFINLKEFRKENIENKFIKTIDSFNGNHPVLSEGIINLVCKGKILPINPKFNLMSGFFDYKKHVLYEIKDYYSEKTIEDAINAPVIIHYLSALYDRPWFKDCSHPLKDRYLFYKSISYWKGAPLLSNKISLKLYLIKIFFNIFPAKLIRFIRNLKNKI